MKPGYQLVTEGPFQVGDMIETTEGEHVLDGSYFNLADSHLADSHLADSRRPGWSISTVRRLKVPVYRKTPPATFETTLEEVGGCSEHPVYTIKGPKGHDGKRVEVKVIG